MILILCFYQRENNGEEAEAEVEEDEEVIENDNHDAQLESDEEEFAVGFFSNYFN